MNMPLPTWINRRNVLLAAAGLAAAAALVWAFAPSPVAVETAVIERGRF